MIPAHNGGWSKPVILRVVQLIFASLCLAISIIYAIDVAYSNAPPVVSGLCSAIAMVDASIGWRAITSKTAKKRNVILAWDFIGLVALFAAFIALILDFTVVANLSFGILEGPAAFFALMSMAMLVWQLCWMVPATTKQKDGLIRYSEIQGRKQDIELEVV